MIAVITSTFAIIALLLSLLVETASARSSAITTNETVILLHGLGRTSASMFRMKYFLLRQGYQVVNVSYPSTRRAVKYLSDVWLAELLEQNVPASAARIHFVTHSLGGIIVRQYLSSHELPRLGRVVMLAPPNSGSEIMDRLKSFKSTRKLLGFNRLELGTSPADVPQQLGKADFDCGIIAGDRSLNPFLSWMLTGPNDGKVTVQSTRLAGMRDFLVLHYSHTWLMWRQRTLAETLSFLQSGHFQHSGTLPKYIRKNFHSQLV